MTTNMGVLHIVGSTDLDAENIQRIATVNNSDHDGIHCSIKFAWYLNGKSIYRSFGKCIACANHISLKLNWDFFALIFFATHKIYEI